VRKVSATELVAIASAVDRPIDWFVVESPPSVVSRRADASVGGQSRVLDIKIERLARDVTFLIGQGVLADAGEMPDLRLPSDAAGAEALAAEARRLMAAPVGPLCDLQRACERVGLLAFSLDVGEAGDAGYVEVGSMGVALVNGSADPGRRRTGADFIALGERWEAELGAPAVPPEYGKRVLGAYRAGRLAAARTVELLCGTVTIEDLPAGACRSC